MNSPTTHTQPALLTIAREQVFAVGLFIRSAGLLLLATYLLVIGATMSQLVRFISDEPSKPSMTNFTFTPEISSIVMLLALIIPLKVWQDEEPAKRSYHWVMPLPRHVHTLLKVFAGWVWTMLATLLFVLGTVALAIVAERITGIPQKYHAHFGAWEWLVPFTAATIAYLFSSSAAVGGRRPFMWLFIAVGIYFFVILLLVKLGLADWAKEFRSVWAGRYGASAAMTGADIAIGQAASGPYAELGRWLGVTAIWGGIAAVLLYYQAAHHRAPR